MKAERNLDYPVRQGVIQAIVAWPVETLGDQTDRSRGGISARQPTDLAGRQSETIGGPDGLQITIDDCLNTLQPV